MQAISLKESKRDIKLVRSSIQLNLNHPTYCHIIFRNIGGNFQLILCDGRVQMLDTGQRMHFGLDGGRHECGEPPGHHFRPECGVHNVEGLQILLVPIAKKREKDK